MSFLKRVQADAMHACQDVYSNWVLGDDAGKSARLTLVLRPTSLAVKKSSRHPNINARLDLGMTFLEINGRAYVNSVAPNSPAALAGILPQDAVQFAMVCDPGLDDGSSSKMEGKVLKMEQAGKRISYQDLRNMLAQAMDPTQAAFISPSPQQGSNFGANLWTGPPIPSTVNVCAPIPAGEDDNHELFSGEAPKPVVFCFRRTRQRQVQTISPSFRIDDECDLATSLVKRLAPTADMETPLPDTWDELVHDGTDWLLGRGSMLPPQSGASAQAAGGESNARDDAVDSNGSIPLDDLELQRARKLAALRSRMTAESMVDRTDDVEAVTIRGMIQKAVGLAFVRASKIVLGVSVHGGSGIVLARLSDGTWSAPSAIGTWGIGLGFQFGLEVAEYIFILQTQEALDHFKRGGSFTVGGNMGIAFAGMGREAYGAASVGGGCGNPAAVIQDDEYNDTDSNDRNKVQSSLAIAPIVAYAKSQGLYIGVSLEGSRIFSRDDINGRTYKFTAGRDVKANDILGGKVPTPPEAEELYAALHSVEFTHEMSCLPRPPEVLRADSANGWYYNQNTLVQHVANTPAAPVRASHQIASFLDALSPKEAEECESFEAQFKNFLYGGVSVQRLLPGTKSRSGRTAKERRTLWLMLPETGSLRLGFVSKLSDGEGGDGAIPTVSNESSTQRARREDPSRLSGLDADVGTVGSEELTLDSALHTKDGGSTIGHIRTGNVQLSHKHSVALTDVTALSQEPKVKISFKEEEQMEQLRVISIQDVSGTSLLFLANNFREAELLVCGLKLLIEREAARLGVRGGLPMSSYGNSRGAKGVSPQVARGFRDRRSRNELAGKKSSGYVSSDVGEDTITEASGDLEAQAQGRRSWGSVPGRNYMRGQAAALTEANTSDRLKHKKDGHYNLTEQGVPTYVHGQSLVKEIETNIRLPLPFPLARVLLLDSTSPVVMSWEKERGDLYFEKSQWTFPTSTPRGLERHSSEHQLIASGSMHGAHRTISFDRPRYGSMVRLSETQQVDSDDSKKLTLTILEHNPRRGFSVQVRIFLRAHREIATDATILADIRPVGKDMSNQAAVHKAFLLVLEELNVRYGLEHDGLLGGFHQMVDDMEENKHGEGELPALTKRAPSSEEKKVDYPIPTKKDSAGESGLISFEDMLKTGRQSPTRSSPETVPSTRKERSATPSMLQRIPEPDPSKRIAANAHLKTPTKEASTIEVKPLPKIRLSLMPSPREEDEDMSSSSPIPSKPVRKKKKSKQKRRSSSRYRQSPSS